MSSVTTLVLVVVGVGMGVEVGVGVGVPQRDPTGATCRPSQEGWTRLGEGITLGGITPWVATMGRVSGGWEAEVEVEVEVVVEVRLPVRLTTAWRVGWW